MIDCHNRIDGICTIATYLAKHQINVVPPEETCLACSKTDNPKSINHVTCGLATLRLVENKLYSSENFSDLKNCNSTYGSLTNKPGTALARILAKAGVHEKKSCECETYAATMDIWGWQGCFDRRKEIIQHLNNQQVDWLDMLKVAAAGYFTTESLVNHALEISKP
jgi:hypothetical protein